MNQQFIDDLKAVFTKHQMALLGTIQLYQITPENEFITDSLKIEYQKDNKCYGGTWRGDFLNIECDKVEPEPAAEFERKSFTVLDREALVRDGVKSPLDDKVYYSRKAYDDHAKRHDSVLVGSDFQSKRQYRLDKMAAKKEAADKASKGNLTAI